jgi:DNA (cytosine-5)-methyltransferase 1
MNPKLKCLSLFCSGGLAETYFEEIGIEVVLANELREDRCAFYKHLYPKTEVIQGDITKDFVKNEIIKKSIECGVDFIIATPPCQGMSRHGKRDKNDTRNELITHVINIILKINPKYVLIENVPMQLRTSILVDNKKFLIPDYIKSSLENNFKIYDESIFDSSMFGVPQSRKRSIFRMVNNKVKIKWGRPKENDFKISLNDCLSQLPSLDPLVRQSEKRYNFPEFKIKKEAGLKVSKWHYPPTHSWHLIETMIHTPTGKSAFENDFFYPKKSNGDKVKGRISCYKRYRWDNPANTVTQNNGVISSAVCVHPGRKIIKNNTVTYSDPRVLTIFELMIISSLPKNWDIPDWASEKLIRNIIGDGIPPLLVKRIMKELLIKL